jgi:hypothetical protein
MAMLYWKGDEVGEVQVQWTRAAFRPDLGGVLGQERPARVALTLATYSTIEFLGEDNALEFEDDSGELWAFRCSGVDSEVVLTGEAFPKASR